MKLTDDRLDAMSRLRRTQWFVWMLIFVAISHLCDWFGFHWLVSLAIAVVVISHLDSHFSAIGAHVYANLRRQEEEAQNEALDFYEDGGYEMPVLPVQK